MKFANYVNGKSVSKDISVDEMERALLSIIRHVQQKAFRGEYTSLSKEHPVAASSKLQRLNPLLRDGVLRVGGRLDHADVDEPHPIILP